MDKPQPPTQPQPPLEAVIRGDDGPNVLVGNALDNEIFGLGGNDTISGLAGNDEIHGGTGRDVLTGNEGQDTFFFDTRPNRSTNWDKITDFRRQDDTIALDDRYFKKLGSSVSNGELRLGTDARDSNDYLIYNRKTGNLYYDADANGSGTKVLIAQFTNKPLLKAADFDIF
ncbi:M10 family metallopeptidase C-terminal domain-containing protein [Microvirga mediterraneensis]|uniref:Calcium-binding protein n=1 Tax=Microvirga mediterraneensis TaxID=2754695 RepID=A0A838BN40_9HYPH|nr:calcium-binding protein [Microvirga mediterraneensis]